MAADGRSVPQAAELVCPVRIYGADGRIFLVKERFTGDLMFRLPVKGLYIVKVGDQTRKVAYH